MGAGGGGSETLTRQSLEELVKKEITDFLTAKTDECVDAFSASGRCEIEEWKGLKVRFPL